MIIQLRFLTAICAGVVRNKKIKAREILQRVWIDNSHMNYRYMDAIFFIVHGVLIYGFPNN